MTKKQIFPILVFCGLGLLCGCSEETDSKKQPAPQQKTKVIAEQSAEQSFVQQIKGMEKSMGELTQTLETISNSGDTSSIVDEENVNKLAKQLGSLAKQAGQSARSLEKTGKTLSEAIEQGFNEGYEKESE